jgi:hypothetical protein
MVFGEKLYSDAAKASDWLRLGVKNDEALQETAKEANSKVGNVKSFYGIQRLIKILLNACRLR